MVHLGDSKPTIFLEFSLEGEAKLGATEGMKTKLLTGLVFFISNI